VGALGVLAAAVFLVLGRGPDDIRSDPERRVDLGQGACPGGASDSGFGPDMVRLPQGFCIDKTEVTRGQYAAWLDTAPATSGQTGACAGNEDFTPSCQWKPGTDENRPVVCVDWCDAKAFCESAGKRLCGRIGDGGGYPFERYDDATISEWHAACTSGGRYDYPYGSVLDTTVCRGADAEDHTTWGLGDVGSFPGCHSPDPPYGDVYDLSGNAAEWDGSCDGDGPSDGCRIRGGSFEHNEHGLRCAMGRDLHWPRMRRVSAVGFRCCAE
ncbi:MAG: SUMF1/EgtB/PvdO family nonheme iron enzyme, partial [Coriobacteriia bacterium]|nr:SUMF1/EgtB/PvdO family nonheme iron enzyme [Coriobacteriia bacterium]